jgi:hypothetical protein
VPYPLVAAEAQGGVIVVDDNNNDRSLRQRHDLVVISGFRDGYAGATARVYALDLSLLDDNIENNAAWRTMDDIPVPEGVTHAAFCNVGTKIYMCGGYVFCVL